MPVPTHAECQKLVGAMAVEAAAQATLAVRALGTGSSSADLAAAESTLRTVADNLRRAQQFLAQWP